MIRNALFIFGICAAVFVFFLPSYLQMQELHQKNSSYDRQIREITSENQVLLEEKQRLEHDPEYLERVGREKFGILKDGEVIYKILPDGQKPTPLPPVDVKAVGIVKPGKAVLPATNKKALPLKNKTGKIPVSSSVAVKPAVNSKMPAGKKAASKSAKKIVTTTKKVAPVVKAGTVKSSD